MKFVIIEGVDGAGKSHLAKQICHEFHCGDIVPIGPPKTDDPFCEYVDDVAKYLYYRHMTVFDRFHFGTVAYGVEFRDKPDLTEQQFKTLEFLLSRHGAIVVYADPPWDLVIKNLQERTELSDFEKDIKRLARVNDLMLKCFVATSLPKFRYDYTVRGSIDILYNHLEAQGFKRRPGHEPPVFVP